MFSPSSIWRLCCSPPLCLPRLLIFMKPVLFPPVRLLRMWSSPVFPRSPHPVWWDRSADLRPQLVQAGRRRNLLLLCSDYTYTIFHSLSWKLDFLKVPFAHLSVETSCCCSRSKSGVALVAFPPSPPFCLSAPSIF